MGFDFASTGLECTSQGYASKISYSGVISQLTLLATCATNRRDWSDMQAVELWSVTARSGDHPFVPSWPYYSLKIVIAPKVRWLGSCGPR